MLVNLMYTYEYLLDTPGYVEIFLLTCSNLGTVSKKCSASKIVKTLRGSKQRAEA